MAYRPPRRGEIWLAFTPGQPRDPHQPRPVLVISEAIRNRNRDDLLVIPIFSGGRVGPTRIPIVADTGGISHDSILFCEQITTLHHDFRVDGPLGEPVPSALLERVVRAVRRAVGDVVPEPDDERVS